MASNDGKVKLYEVIKALTAMRLCKEDSTPSAILSRLKKEDGTLDNTIVPSPHPPKPEKAEEAEEEKKTEEIEVHETTIAKEGGATPENSEPCIFQGSIGAAYNKEALQKHGITHILTCASNINPRF